MATRIRDLAVDLMGFGLLVGLVACGSTSDAGSEQNVTTTSASPTTDATEVQGPCSENVILNRVFDEEMVSGCIQVSGVTTITCDDGSVLALIDISGSPVVVTAGSRPQQVGDDVAAPLDPPQPQRFEIDRAKLLSLCP